MVEMTGYNISFYNSSIITEVLLVVKCFLFLQQRGCWIISWVVPASQRRPFRWNPWRISWRKILTRTSGRTVRLWLRSVWYKSSNNSQARVPEQYVHDVEVAQAPLARGETRKRLKFGLNLFLHLVQMDGSLWVAQAALELWNGNTNPPTHSLGPGYVVACAEAALANTCTRS